MANLAATLLLALVRRAKGGGVIVNEHTLSRAETAFHVEVLGRWFDFIRLEHLPHRLARPRRKPFCLLTFDDGKRSNFTETAPELERRQVPAVFYITTEPVTNGSCFWFDRREQLVRALGHCPAGLEIDTLKQLPFDTLMRRLDRAWAEHGSEPEIESDDLRPMTWDEVRNLHQRGFTIGAHGLTHAILTRETRKRAYAEIEASLARVSEEIGAPCTTFAFPNGNHNPALAQHAFCSGARTAMTTEPMWADKTASLSRLPRIQLFGGASRARIESKIALAAFKGVLASPDGNGRRYRAAAGNAAPFPLRVPVSDAGC
ncbi:MAG TPA: polysaccharide deacetylase family protein [Candidatus Paceibacterota bacterium]|nr:polysaccharide deacetylase family protein [Verrucomicrobiota bacterium]HSA08824.1 polysaccharide deacetylase family protein [Candidatus Paceibacterota bacterium]